MPAIVIHITIPDPETTRVLDQMAIAHNYETTKLTDETKREFLDRKLLDFIFDGVGSAEANVAATAAGNTARTSARAIALSTT